MDIAEELKNIAGSILVSENQFIVDVIVSSKRDPAKVLVIIDGDHGITIDDCAELSRNLSAVLDEKGFFQERYTLEVSTPGLDQPLKMKRQYYKNIGRGLKVKHEGKISEGVLKEVDDNLILLEEKTGTGKNKELTEKAIPFSVIEQAFVTILFK